MDIQTKTLDALRTRPLLWAGIAAGTGLGLGLVGRFLQWRSHRGPKLLVIERTC